MESGRPALVLIVNDKCVRVLAFRSFAARMAGKVGMPLGKRVMPVFQLNRIV